MILLIYNLLIISTKKEHVIVLLSTINNKLNSLFWLWQTPNRQQPTYATLTIGSNAISSHGILNINPTYIVANKTALKKVHRLLRYSMKQRASRSPIMTVVIMGSPVKCHENKVQRLTIIRSAINIFLP